MRWIDLFVALAFLLMAAVQINDPDPAYWILVYGATALLGRFTCVGTAMAIGAAGVGLLDALPGFVQYFLSGDPESLTGAMLAEKPWVEPAREFLGLAMALAALLWYLNRANTARRSGVRK